MSRSTHFASSRKSLALSLRTLMYYGSIGIRRISTWSDLYDRSDALARPVLHPCVIAGDWFYYIHRRTHAHTLYRLACVDRELHVGSIPLGAWRAPPFLWQSFDDCTVVGRTSAFAERHVFSSNLFSLLLLLLTNWSEWERTPPISPPPQKKKPKKKIRSRNLKIDRICGRIVFLFVNFVSSTKKQERKETVCVCVCLSGGIKQFC
jgi:hypothetical protein